MSFNGSGTFNINSTGQPVVSGTVISSSTFNTLTADLATGLSTCITKDGQTTVTANIPMNSYKITGLGAGTAATDAARVGQLQAGAASVVTVAGTDTYTGTMSPSLGAYAAGNTFTFVVPNTNTTAVTLNIDGLGAKALTRDGSTALVAGDLVANAEVVVVYDGTRFQVLNSNSKTNFNLSGTLTVAGNTTLSGGTANGVAYLNASKVLTTGSALTWDGSTFYVKPTGAQFVTGATFAKIENLSGASASFIMADTTDSATIKNVASSIAFINSVTEGMRLTSTGLGIGTSSPAYKLDVNGVANFAANVGHRVGAALFFAGTGTSSGLNYLYSNTTAIVWRNSTDTSELMRLDNNGNFSVGTTAGYGGRIMVTPASTPTTVVGGNQIVIGESSNNTQYRLQLGYINETTAGFVGSIQAYGAGVATNLLLQGAGGNVGIGTVSATSRLTVSSTASTYAVDIASTNTSINNRTLNVYNSAATGTTALTNQIVRLASNGSGADCTLQFTDSVANNGYIGMKSGALNFGANTTTTQMTLDTSGNLGIGVSPTSKLNVEGANTTDGPTSFLTNLRNSGAQTSGVGTGIAFSQKMSSFNAVLAVVEGVKENGTADNYASAMVFSTRPNAANLAERMRIASAGNVTINAPASGTALTVTGAVSATGDGSSVSYYVAAGGAIRTAGTGALYIDTATTTGTEIVFRPATVERMRLDTSGNLLVGTTGLPLSNGRVSASSPNTNAVRAYISGTSQLATAAAVFEKADNNTTTSNVFVQFTINAQATGSGQINANGANAAAFGSFSDRRLKENIVGLPPQLANIMALRPVEFDYIESEGGGHQISFIAQEFEQVYPDAVGERADGMLTITGWSKTEARLVKAMQEQQALIESLTARLNSLENK